MGRRLPALAALWTIAFFGLVATATAAPTWLSPVDLSASGRDADDALVAMDDRGGSIAIWSREGTTPFERTVQVSIRSPGEAFPAPMNLSLGQDPTMTMAPSGEAIAAWWYFKNLPGVYVLRASFRPPGGTFSAPVDVVTELPGEIPHGLSLAMNAGGDGAAVWLEKDETTSKNVVMISTRPAGGGFSEPFELSDSEHLASQPEVAVDPAGAALVVWTDFTDDESPRAVLFSRGKGESFTPAATLSTTDSVSEPKIALDSAGDPTVIWSGAEKIEPPPEPPEYPFEPGVIETTSRTGEGLFSAPVPLSDPAESAFEPQLAVSPAGEATAVWVRSNGTNWIAQASVRPPGGAFGGAVDLSPEGEDAARPELVANSAGTAIAAWQIGSPQVIQAAIRSPGAGFGAPADLSVPGEPALFPQLGIDDAGDAVAVWRRDGGDKIAQAAAYDASSPVFRSVSIPSQGTVGVPVTFSADPFDVWSIASTTFDFGDGSTQAGDSVSHAYAAPGSYPVAVTAVDQAGNPVTAGGTIAIDPVYEFRIGKHKRNKKRGTVLLTVELPGPGNVVAKGNGVRRQQKHAASAGSVKLLIAAKGKALKRLKEKGKARVRVTISFAPDGGDHSTSQRILLVLITKQ